MAANTNLHRRRELYKLIVARDSMNSVAEAAGIAVALKADHNHPLYKVLHDNIVTSYGRAFTEMKPLGTLPAKWAKFDDKEHQEAHDMLMYHRNKSVGHTDYIKGKIVLFPKGSKRTDGHTTDRVQYEVLTQSFAPNAYIPIQKLAGNLAGRLDIEISKQMTTLYGEEGKDLIDITELITEEDLIELSQGK